MHLTKEKEVTIFCLHNNVRKRQRRGVTNMEGIQNERIKEKS